MPKFEAEMLESHGYPDDAQAWWKKVKQLDDDVRADLLRLATCVNQLRRERLRRPWRLMRIYWPRMLFVRRRFTRWARRRRR